MTNLTLFYNADVLGDRTPRALSLSNSIEDKGREYAGSCSNSWSY